MDEKRTKRSGGLVALVVLLLIVTIVSAILATYAWAKYTEKVAEGNATAVVAKWNVTSTIDGVAQYTKEFTHVVQTKMAPGTSGVIPVEVKLNDTEVCVKYDIYIDSVTNNPTNVKFYEATKNGDDFEKGAALTGTQLTGGAIAITGFLELDDDETSNAATKSTRYIMWDWPYETTGADYTGTANEGKTADEVDTADGKAAQTMTVKVRVVATQVDPNSAANSDN